MIRLIPPFSPPVSLANGVTQGRVTLDLLIASRASPRLHTGFAPDCTRQIINLNNHGRTRLWIFPSAFGLCALLGKYWVRPGVNQNTPTYSNHLANQVELRSTNRANLLACVAIETSWLGVFRGFLLY